MPNYKLLATLSDGTVIDAGTLKIPDSGAPEGSGGVTSDAVLAALEQIRDILSKAVYTENVSSMLSELDGLLENIDTDDSGATTKTLIGITAAYSGGAVAAGTALSALNGIVVTACYSDGTTVIVTGYSLSGSIAEGTNTVAVFYGGKTTTFTVTGYVTAAALAGITASYSGGPVPVGTLVHDLSGVAVTASYSDGSATRVTGWTFIADYGDVVTEGNNTVWVRYEDYEASFIVIGIAVDEEADVTQVGNTLIVKSGVTVTKSGSALNIA